MMKPNVNQVTAQSAGEAITILRSALHHGLSASYLPIGGQTAKRTIPIRHEVFIIATPEQMDAFRKAMLKESPHAVHS